MGDGDILYSELVELGADVDTIKKLNPTERQLAELKNGLARLRAEALAVNN